MSLQDLQKELQRQVISSGAITVSAATIQTAHLVPSPGFDITIQGYLKLSGALSVTITQPIAAPSGNTLTVSGTATFLNLSGVPVDLVFTLERDSTVDLRLATQLDKSWQFSDCFPLLQGYPFAGLALTETCFLLTTSEEDSYTWQKQTIKLQQGLNLVSFLGMGGQLSVLQSLISALKPDVKVVFMGTIDPRAMGDISTSCPILSLTGTINQPITANTHFALSLPEVLLASANDENNNLAYWLSFSSTLSVDGAPFCQFQASIPQNGSSLSFCMLPTNKPITSDEIIQLIDFDFTKSIPSELRTIFQAVSLKGLAIVFDVKPPQVLALSAAVGSSGPWKIGEFEIEQTTLSYMVFDPFGVAPSSSVSFSAEAKIYPKVFEGVFFFEIGYNPSNDDMTIAASFQGTVSLNKVVSGISGNKIVLPQQLVSIIFSDFGITFTKAGDGYDWSLYGGANATFPLSIAGGTVSSDLQVAVQSLAGKEQFNLVGGLIIGDSVFAAQLNLNDSAKTLQCSWHSVGQPLEFEDIAGAFGFPLPPYPKSLKLALTEASFTYDFANDLLVLTATSENYGKAVFASLELNDQREYFFLLGVDQSIDLSNLPLIGQELASIESVSLSQIQVIIASTDNADTVEEAREALANQIPAGYPTLPETSIGSKVALTAQLVCGNDTVPLSLSIGGSTADTGTTALGTTSRPVSSLPSASTSDGTKWFSVQKSFGPVSIQRLGLRFQKGDEQQSDQLWFEMDATLAFGPLSLSLLGLGIGSPLTTFAPSFNIVGLGVTYSNPPLQISGSLLNLEPPGSSTIAFQGTLIVSTQDFTVEAIGYYGNQAGFPSRFPSLFVFINVEHAFGGPPAFFVTGLAGGFGFNSALRLPTLEQVAIFPFIAALPGSPDPPFGTDSSALSVLRTITSSPPDTPPGTPAWVTPSAGDLWFAVGIAFTSFEMVNSKALLVVEAGHDLVISLLGTSTARFPQDAADDDLYAFVELNLLARFQPSAGVFSVEAVLSSGSFVLDRACALTGGFAFYVWSGDNPNAGDFVLTLGGYHPSFAPPPHYPTVPQLGFHWSLDSSISVKGHAYFALTPSVFMVGGELDVTYQSGDLKAWLNAHADALIRWKPFWFEVSIGVTVGASYEVDLWLTSATFSVELGCDLEFYGPPTGGSITVDWWVISFTIPFGASNDHDKETPVWSDVEAMLPNTAGTGPVNVLSVLPVSGLISTSNGSEATGTALALTQGTRGVSPAANTSNSSVWRVRASDFGFSTATPIPASTATFTDPTGQLTSFTGDKFDVHPLGWLEVSATHAVRIFHTDKKDAGNGVAPQFKITAILSNVPASLWGAPPEGASGPQVPDGTQQLVLNQITGVKCQVNPPTTGYSAGSVDAQCLKATNLPLPGAKLPLKASVSPTGDVPANNQQTIRSIADRKHGIASDTATIARNAIYDGLQTLQFAPDTNDPLDDFANSIGCALVDEPLLVS